MTIHKTSFDKYINCILIESSLDELFHLNQSDLTTAADNDDDHHHQPSSTSSNSL